MKKTLLIVSVIALVFSLCMIGAFADGSSLKGVSRDQLTIVEENNKDVALQGGNSDPTAVDLTGYVGKTLRIWGWVATVSKINGFGYRINGGEFVTQEAFTFPAEAGVVNAATNLGGTESSRYDIRVPIAEGSYTIDAYCVMESGTERIWSVDVNGGNPDNPKWNDAAQGGNIGLWLRNKNERAVAKFTTKYAFDAVKLPTYWASTIANQGGTPIFSLSIYKYSRNVEESLEAEPLVTKNIEAVGDANPAALFEFGKELPAGTYYFVVETVGTNGKEFNGTNDNCYLVLPTVGEASAEYFNQLVSGKHATDPVNFSIRCKKTDAFDVNPDEVPTPEISNIDFVLLFDGAGFVENFGKGSNIGQIKNAVAKGGNNLYFVGWYINAAKQVTAIGAQTDDGEIVWNQNLSFAQGTADVITSWGYDGTMYRGYDILVPVQEGAHTVRLIAYFANGTTKVIYETSYRNDDSDIALNKPVFIDLISGVRNAAGYWDDSYVNDGFNPVHNPAVVPDPVPLGFYPAGADIKAKIYIDLQGIYDLSEIHLHPQGFNNQTFPSAYDLYTSADGINWDLVASVEGRKGDISSAEPLVYATANSARYIRLDINGGNDNYASIGEIEAYGTFSKESTNKAPYLPYKTYTGSANLADPGGKSAWTGFTTGTLTYSFTINTDVSFYRIGFPAFWGLNGAPVTVELKQGDKVIVTKNFVAAGDGAVTIDLGEAVPAGEYTVTLTITDATVRPETDENAGAYQYYIVIGYANEGLLGQEYVATERGQIAFDIYSDDDGEGFIKREYKQHPNIDMVYLDGTELGNASGLQVTVDGNSKEIKVHGWLAASYPIEKYGYKIDGGEAVYDDAFMGKEVNADYNAIMGVAKNLYSVPGNGYRADVIVPVTEGAHSVEIVGLVNGEDKVFYTFAYAPEGVHVPVERSFNSETDNQYFDSIYVNSEAAPRANGNEEVAALKALIDGSNRDISEIGLYGWFSSDSAIAQFGYVLDDADPVFSDDFVFPLNPGEEEAIGGSRAGGKRYLVKVDVSGLEDGKTHVIKVVAKLENGDVVTFDRPNREAIVTYQAPRAVAQQTDENAKTGDVAVFAFAAIAVLALGVAVVFKKKRAF